MIAAWVDPPPMNAGAPQPYLVTRDGVAWVAYRTDRGDHFAVLRFRDVQRLTFGEPGDGRLDEDPLRSNCPQLHTFHVVTSPELNREGLRRWVATFPDETLDVVAREANVIVRAIHAADARSALGMVLA
jgi:hypothetical protein